jgi:hypothetical protein
MPRKYKFVRGPNPLQSATQLEGLWKSSKKVSFCPQGWSPFTTTEISGVGGFFNLLLSSVPSSPRCFSTRSSSLRGKAQEHRKSMST